MQSVGISTAPVVGALSEERTADGVIYRRVPAWAQRQIADPWHKAVAAMPAGVRLELGTTSRSLELDAVVTSFGIGTEPLTTPAFDLVVGGSVRATWTVQPVEALPLELTDQVHALTGPPATVRFDGLPGDPTVPVEVWLPHGAIVELVDVRVDDGAAVVDLERSRPRWVHHGSSISHGISAPSPTATWPARVALDADVDLLNLGVAGHCMLDQHVARAIRDTDAAFVSIEVGINIVTGDTMRERTFVPALHGFLDTIRDGHPDVPVVLVSPIVCPATEDHPGPTVVGEDGAVHVVPRADPALMVGALTLRRLRELVAEVVAGRREQDPQLHLFDGLRLFGADDVADLPDGLHPNAAGHVRIGERFHAMAFGPTAPFASARRVGSG